jgi:hypothetical protein
VSTRRFDTDLFTAAQVAYLRQLIHDASEQGTFSTHDLPPYTSKRVFHEFCRSGRVAGAAKQGRAWVCERAAWFEARRTKPAKPTALAPSREHVVTLGDDAIVEAALAAGGYRRAG